VYFEDIGGNANNEEDYLERNIASALEGGGDPGALLADKRFRNSLIAAIENLPEREKQLMGMYYEQDMNLREIGAVMGVTESRVCQLHSQAVARLRAKLKNW
jgi:RNA polymerase sigma factor for flagellar operon FliA